MRKPIIVITGPTACGKTALSVRVTKALDGEIICTDSMQIYRGMDIGTAKVRPEEMKGIPHHLVDFVPPECAYSVAEFQRDARAVIEEIYARGKVPILVGGHGLRLFSHNKRTGGALFSFLRQTALQEYSLCREFPKTW